MFQDFKINFQKHIAQSKANSQKSYFALRSEWGFDAEQLLRNKTSPRMETFFNYCNGIKSCVAQVLISCYKNHIDPHQLVAYINKIYDTNYTQQQH